MRHAFSACRSRVLCDARDNITHELTQQAADISVTLTRGLPVYEFVGLSGGKSGPTPEPSYHS